MKTKFCTNEERFDAMFKIQKKAKKASIEKTKLLKAINPIIVQYDSIIEEANEEMINLYKESIGLCFSAKYNNISNMVGECYNKILNYDEEKK